MQHEGKVWVVPGHEKYVVDHKGNVFGPDGKPKTFKVKGSRHLYLYIDGLKRKQLHVAAVAYYGPFIEPGKIVQRDGDPLNCGLDNLNVIKSHKVRAPISATPDETEEQKPEPADPPPGDWRQIKDAPGYFANGCGDVWSFEQGGLLEVSTTGKYHRVKIGRKWWPVHWLVAETFIGPRPEGHVVVHLDYDYQNNRPDNLKYMTREDNFDRRLADGKASPTLSDVQAVREALAEGVEEELICDLVGVTKAVVRRAAKGKRFFCELPLLEDHEGTRH